MLLSLFPTSALVNLPAVSWLVGQALRSSFLDPWGFNWIFSRHVGIAARLGFQTSIKLVEPTAPTSNESLRRLVMPEEDMSFLLGKKLNFCFFRT